MSRWKKRVLQLLDLPTEVTSTEPRIEWVKNGYLQIENHQGIQYFSEQEIKVLAKNQVLSISGKKLKIKTINAYLIQLTGEIEQIRYVPKGR